MGIKCKIFGHKWNYCKCAVCGESRNSDHDWNHCQCKICRKKRDSNHVWKNCKCEVCNKIADVDNPVHEWNGCKCTICGKERDSDHIWDNCQCVMCGKRRDFEHEYNNDGKCVICGTPEALNRHNHLLFTKNPKVLIFIADCYGESLYGNFKNRDWDKPQWDTAFSRRTEMDDLVTRILAYAPNCSGIHPNDVKLIRPAVWHSEIIPMKISELTDFMAQSVANRIKTDEIRNAIEYAVNNHYDVNMNAHPCLGMFPDWKVAYVTIELFTADKKSYGQ